MGTWGLRPITRCVLRAEMIVASVITEVQFDTRRDKMNHLWVIPSYSYKQTVLALTGCKTDTTHAVLLSAAVNRTGNQLRWQKQSWSHCRLWLNSLQCFTSHEKATVYIYSKGTVCILEQHNKNNIESDTGEAGRVKQISKDMHIKAVEISGPLMIRSLSPLKGWS